MQPSGLRPLCRQRSRDSVVETAILSGHIGSLFGSRGVSDVRITADRRIGHSGCGLAGAAWLAPPQREVAQVTVMLPAATHQKLALWARDRADPDGRPLTVVQVIEELVNKREKNSGGPAK